MSFAPAVQSGDGDADGVVGPEDSSRRLGAGAVVLAAAASALGAAFAFAAFFGAAGVALLDAVFFTAMIFNPWSREIIAAVVRIAIGDGRFSRARRICW